MERRPDVGFDSYDRFFPNQDTLPQGGFGNLIALPLAEQPRERGNSLFLDDDFNPHADQWAFLSSVEKTGRAQVEDLVRNAERSGNVVGVRFPLAEEDEPEPWTTPPSRRRKEPPIAGRTAAQPGARTGDRDLYCQRGSAASPAKSPAPASPPFRILSSTRRRRCGCRPMVNRE